MRLVDPPGKVVDGSIHFDGVNILDLDESEIADIRGNRISMIFQQPVSSLDPIYKIGNQISEALQAHRNLSKKESWQRMVELLKKVGIPDPERRAHAYPHELSGGMAQRVMIAMGLACAPELLIADEPTTALDVTIQAQILDLMRGLQAETGTAVILITHNLGVVAEIAERVAVMYAGRVVEEAGVDTLFKEPLHPYTQGLMGAVPVLGQLKDMLDTIPGTVPNLVNLPPGCKFAPRCRARVIHELEVCTMLDPELQPVNPGHRVSCWLYHNSDQHQAPLNRLLEK
jgi:oligopeptide/dipeptide ABC transporter ATP-binding protein